MKRRMTLATLGLGIALTALTGCASDDDPAVDPYPTTPSPSPTTTTESPSVEPDGAAALVGDWEIPSEDYVLHLHDDGTFVQDFQGITDFRSGTYTVEGGTLSLVGDDGDTDEGTIDGDTLVFTLGTATRMQ